MARAFSPCLMPDLSKDIATSLILSLSKDEAPCGRMVRQAHHEGFNVPPTLTLPRKGGGDAFFTLRLEGGGDAFVALSLESGRDSAFFALPLEGGGRGGGGRGAHRR